jgi:SAM-dependent methyltransferase
VTRLDAIRTYNHTLLDQLARRCSLEDKRLLDIGACSHGYALERALQLRVREYVGIGPDIEQNVEVKAGQGIGKLLRMNAEQLAFADESFDLIVSLSTFEQLGTVSKLLAEIRRTLKTGGSALIAFEPAGIGSCRHDFSPFSPTSDLVPGERTDLARLREQFAHCGLVLEGIAPLGDQEQASERVPFDSEQTNVMTSDLMTRGITAYLTKVAA